jgi:hypothetical protein
MSGSVRRRELPNGSETDRAVATETRTIPSHVTVTTLVTGFEAF